MYGLIHKASDMLSSHVVVFEVAKLVELAVDARGQLEMHPALEAKQACLHREEIVALRFLEVGVPFFMRNSFAFK